MDEINKCLICRNFCKEVFALKCGHKIVCKDCAEDGQVFCEDCGEPCEPGMLFLGNDLFGERKILSYIGVRIEDEVMDMVYKNIVNLEERKRFLRVYKNFFEEGGVCFRCEEEEISFLDFRDAKGYCYKCRTSSSVCIDSTVVHTKTCILREELIKTMTVFANSLSKEFLDNPTAPHLHYIKTYLFTQFAKGLNGFVSRCPWCKELYDYIHRVPLTYTCKFEDKHIFCTQCYYKGEKSCVLDKVKIKNVRLYNEIIDVVNCKNNCGYLGVNFFMFESNEFICENCQKPIETGKGFNSEVKTCLMFFKLLCKQHKKIVNFFNREKFEGFCYYCRDYEAGEVDGKQLIKIIEGKQKWIREEMVRYLNKQQLCVLENTDFLEFLSVKEKFGVIKEFLEEMNGFLFSEPRIKPSITQNYIIPEDQFISPGNYSEEITLKADSDFFLNGLLLKPRPEIVSCFLTIYQGTEIIIPPNPLLESSKGMSYLEKPYKLPKNTSFSIKLTFTIQHNFPIHLYHKVPNPQSLTQNNLILTYSILSHHRANILTRGLILTNN